IRRPLQIGTASWVADFPQDIGTGLLSNLQDSNLRCSMSMGQADGCQTSTPFPKEYRYVSTGARCRSSLAYRPERGCWSDPAAQGSWDRMFWFHLSKRRSTSQAVRFRL